MLKLYEIASRFRKAIEEAVYCGEIIEINMQKFPQGCCTYASDLLQKYLYEQGIPTYLISGHQEYGYDGESHSWLETEDGTVIDITVDQFAYREPRFITGIYVGKREDGFHNLFELSAPIPYNANISQHENECLREEFIIRYKKVLKHMANV